MLTLTRHNNADAVLIELMKRLKINISPETVITELAKHPDYPSLLSISDVLSNFQIENNAFRLQADELPVVPTPFIAHTRINKGDFVLINELNDDHILFFNEKDIKRIQKNI